MLFRFCCEFIEFMIHIIPFMHLFQTSSAPPPCPPRHFFLSPATPFFLSFPAPASSLARTASIGPSEPRKSSAPRIPCSGIGLWSSLYSNGLSLGTPTTWPAVQRVSERVFSGSERSVDLVVKRGMGMRNRVIFTSGPIQHLLIVELHSNTCSTSG